MDSAPASGGGDASFCGPLLGRESRPAGLSPAAPDRAPDRVGRGEIQLAGGVQLEGHADHGIEGGTGRRGLLLRTADQGAGEAGAIVHVSSVSDRVADHDVSAARLHGDARADHTSGRLRSRERLRVLPGLRLGRECDGGRIGEPFALHPALLFDDFVGPGLSHDVSPSRGGGRQCPRLIDIGYRQVSIGVKHKMRGG